jgi:deoxyadenosine/deoxycytidine kinase
LVFFHAYHAAGAYDSNDLATLLSLYEALAAQLPTPDAIVVPWAPFDLTLERIAARGRIAEREIDHSFLEGVYDRYSDWLVDYSEIPIVKIDSSLLDFVHSPEDQAETLRQIDKALEGVGLTV